LEGIGRGFVTSLGDKGDAHKLRRICIPDLNWRWNSDVRLTGFIGEAMNDDDSIAMYVYLVVVVVGNDSLPFVNAPRILVSAHPSSHGRGL
jgi:hypothetical protein